MQPTTHPNQRRKPIESLFSTLLGHLDGPSEAHEDVAWCILADAITAECADPWNDAQLRSELQVVARRSLRVRGTLSARLSRPN